MNGFIRLESAGKAAPCGGQALCDVSFSVEAGEWAEVAGPVGSGKTALIRLIAGMERPDGGRVFVAGRAVHEMNEGEAAAFRSGAVGVCLRDPALPPFLPLWENAALPLAVRRVPTAERKRRAGEALRELGIAYAAQALPDALSPYERKLGALARALAAGPPILLLDEFTADLPQAEAARLADLTRSLAQAKRLTVVCCVSRRSDCGAGRRFKMEYGRITEENR